MNIYISWAVEEALLFNRELAQLIKNLFLFCPYINHKKRKASSSVHGILSRLNNAAADMHGKPNIQN